MIPNAVLVVGGGRTGWIAAAYLQAVLGKTGRQGVEITVLEAPENQQSRAAEACTLNMKHILAAVGIDEIDFLKRTNGTFRQATRYANWLRGTGDFFYHPFDDARAQPIDRAASEWLVSNRSIAFAETVSPQPVICEMGLAPRPFEGPSPDLPLKYAWHADVTDLAALFREIATAAGVKAITGEVAGVNVSASGTIDAVQTDSGDRLEADLFIDCSGTEASLIGRQLEVDWVDCSDWLLCDRQATLDIDYEHYYPGRVQPFTTATALSAGWLRDIPLQRRRSLSYVYSSRHIDEQTAARELQAFEGNNAQSLPVESSSFDIGHRAKTWVGNCVALGSSGGYLDPLESANTHLADLGILALAEHFPLEADMATCAWRFNRVITNRYYEVFDFANMQYALSQRADTQFWRDVSKPEHINDRVKARLEFWKLKPPSQSDFVDPNFLGQTDTPVPSGGLPGDHRSPANTAAVFGLESYESVLYGMQFLAEECDSWYGTSRPATRVPQYIIGDLQQAPRILPPHDQWLRLAAGMPEYAAPGRPRV